MSGSLNASPASSSIACCSSMRRRPQRRKFRLMRYSSLIQHKLVNLTRMYSEIVSYYDTLMDPIKFYFLEKLQHYSAEIAIQSKNLQKERILA